MGLLHLAQIVQRLKMSKKSMSDKDILNKIDVEIRITCGFPVFNALELFAKLTLGVPVYAVGQGEMRINPHFTSFRKFCI